MLIGIHCCLKNITKKQPAGGVLSLAAGGAAGGDATVEEEHLAAHLGRRGAAQEHNTVRHLPGLREATKWGTVDHGVALGGVSVTREHCNPIGDGCKTKTGKWKDKGE